MVVSSGGWGESEFTVVGDSKILTVSYGTFSCTLEGFDEPFSTMKAIAEYFRDLAADDRYFGAEPPTPDTEMLHKIAESTIQRRVAAELAENGVILRQTEATPQVAAETPALAVEMPKADVRDQQSPAPTADVMTSVADVPVAPQRTPVRVAVAPEVAAPEHGGGDTVAEKLQRIRAVVARENTAPAPYSEDQHADEFGASGQDVEHDAPSALFETPIDTDFEDEDGGTLDAVMAGLNVPDEAAEEDTTDAAVADEVETVADDEITDEQPVETAEEIEAEVEDVAALEAEVEAVAEADDTVAEVEAEASNEVEVEAEAEVEAVAEADDATSEVEAEVSVEAEVEAEAEVSSDAADIDEDTEIAASEDVAAAQRTKPRRRIVVQKISRADMEAAQAAKEAELPPEMEAELMAELAEVEAEAATIDETPVVADAEVDTADEIVSDTVAETVEDASLEAEVEAVEAVAVDEPQDDDADDILSRLTSSFDEPIEDTVEETSELSLLDGDASGDDALKSLMEDNANAEAEKEAAEKAERSEERKRKSLAAMAEDDALERLMTTTGSRLENDESSVRRASIAHLKAAVAATKADSSIAEAADKREEEELDQYRDDLARVVRPGRPVAGGTRSDRPSPLVLISEQRITPSKEAADAIAASASGIDVRPRRVTRGNLALQEEMEEEFDTDENLFNEDAQITFAEYAAKAGALELPDLLEAAAAHYIEIDKAEHFTRPMLMRKLAQISGPEAPSREDGLRAFGTLLRTGKIVKTDNGKFTLSKSSQFA